MSAMSRVGAVALMGLLLGGCGKIKELLDGAAGSSKADDKLPPGVVVTIKGPQVLVDDEPAGNTDAIKPGKLHKIDGLFDTLKDQRERWKSFHPNEPFPGNAVLRPDAKTATNVLLSAFQTSAYAGYPNLSVETQSGFVPVQAVIPKPPGMEWDNDGPLPKELHIALDKEEVSLAALHGYLLLSESKEARPDDLRKGLKKIVSKQLAELGKDNAAAESKTATAISLRVDKSLPLADLQNALFAINAAGKASRQPPSLSLTIQDSLQAHHVPSAMLDRDEMFDDRSMPPAPETLDGAGDKSQLIDHRIRSIFPYLRDCYESGLAKDLKLEGSLALRFTITKDGNVSEIDAEGDLPDKDVVECIKKEVKATTFGQLADVTVHYPIKLLPLPEGPAKPPSARMRPDKTGVSGRLPPAVIQRIVRSNFGRFRICYENGLKKDPNLKGRVKVRFVIGRDGSVSNVSGGGDIPDAEVVSCVTRAFYGLTFPEPEGGIVTVSYPIVFTPG